LSWFVTLLVPVALVLTAVRLIANPTFARIEYSTPGFPPDPYGFTKEDRIHWLQYSLDYLFNNEGIDYLGNLRFENGQPVYNPGELNHMQDVKNVFQVALKVWYASLALLAVLGVVAALAHLGDAYRLGLSRGGFLTVLVLGTVTLLALLFFGPVLLTFHETFFKTGTYTFLFSDTLIRLTPERFWRDTFIAVGVIAGGIGLALWYFFKKPY
jgi:integral membrane protein (TIGR01906 family)